MTTPIICLKSDAFYALIDDVIEHVNIKFNLPKEDEWVDSETAMRMLNIKSRTTLQALRDSGKVRYSQPTKKAILFQRTSLLEYIESGAKNTF